MTTADFIAKTFDTTNTKWHDRYGYDRHCSSVFTDKDGNVYSYGYHYPLLFKVGGLTFVNSTGYSNTTSKHISHARHAVSDYINVELNGARLPLTLDDLEAKLGVKVVELKSEMDSKKRTDTQVYKSIEREYDETLAAYWRVKLAVR